MPLYQDQRGWLGKAAVSEAGGFGAAAQTRPYCPKGFGFGLGWEVIQFEDATYLMHTGVDEGTYTLAYYSPTERSGMVILTNGSNGHKIVLPVLERVGMDPVFVGFVHGEAGN